MIYKYDIVHFIPIYDQISLCSRPLRVSLNEGATPKFCAQELKFCQCTGKRDWWKTL